MATKAAVVLRPRRRRPRYYSSHCALRRPWFLPVGLARSGPLYTDVKLLVVLVVIAWGMLVKVAESPAPAVTAESAVEVHECSYGWKWRSACPGSQIDAPTVLEECILLQWPGSTSLERPLSPP